MSLQEEIQHVLYNLTMAEIDNALGNLRLEYSARIRHRKETYVTEVFQRGFGGLLLDTVARNNAAQSSSK